MAPPYWPTWIRDPERPDYAKPDLPSVLVPQSHEHIGDKLSKKNIDWAWVRGGLAGTLEQFKGSDGIPKIPTSVPPPAIQLLCSTRSAEPAGSAASACATQAWAMSPAATAFWLTPRAGSLQP